jgi:hypothetical protein
MTSFKDWIIEEEGFGGYILSSLMTEVSGWLNEGKKQLNRKELAKQDFSYKPKIDKTFFGDEEVGSDPLGKLDRMIDDEGGSCPITPLSGYESHITAIQSFAKSSPENFAQVLMFSPLSANTPFAKHWDNYQMLMSILKHRFPDRVTAKEIEATVKSFNDKYHKLSHTMSSWKFETIADVWSNKDGLFHELNSLSKSGDDISLIKRLSMIQGVAPVKAGFIAQLIWGRAGCIDTHNIDIYSKVFPDMEKSGDFDEKKWSKGASDKRRTQSAKSYVDVLDKLKDRGIGTKQLWDVWVDFVETMYIMITHHGKGYYDYQGGALDPSSDEYGVMRGVKINKKGIGKDGEGVEVPLVGGRFGMGASSTHLPMDPDDALKHFYDLYSRGEIDKSSSLATPDQLAARAVKFRTNPKTGKSIDQNLGKRPTALHYLSPALSRDGSEVDPDHIRHIIDNRKNREKWSTISFPYLDDLPKIRRRPKLTKDSILPNRIG